MRPAPDKAGDWTGKRDQVAQVDWYVGVTSSAMRNRLAQLLAWLDVRPSFRRYRVTPRQSAAAFRRKILTGVIHDLRRDATPAKHA